MTNFLISVIEPVSAETRLIISKDNNTTMPKLFADVTLQEIEVLLSRQQVSNHVAIETRLIICKDKNTTMPKLFADITLQGIEVLLSRQQVM